jgi:YHS domain-containing protein
MIGIYFSNIKVCLTALAVLFVVLILFSCQPKKKQPEYKTVPIAEMSSGTYLENIDLLSLVSLKDTICGMNLNSGVADTLKIGSDIYGFCNTGCKKKFKEKYLAK